MLKYLTFLALFGTIAAEVVKFKPCENSPICTVNEVRFIPCKDPSMCKLKKGSLYSLSYDFTPNVTLDKLRAGFFWASETADVPFPEMHNADACQYTKCPIEDGKQQTFEYSLRLGKKLPRGQFTFKLKLWDETDETKACCFMTTVAITK
ncbi:unnamed protein product [Leptosia nina]|uniref:MD-2-related lipid-recognition domain-containing protein n=1 Tax=Leptosia nina TaxID=320188 RepID=A0AAV1J4E7_9NEOP